MSSPTTPTTSSLATTVCDIGINNPVLTLKIINKPLLVYNILCHRMKKKLYKN